MGVTDHVAIPIAASGSSAAVDTGAAVYSAAAVNTGAAVYSAAALYSGAVVNSAAVYSSALERSGGKPPRVSLFLFSVFFLYIFSLL